MEPSENLSEMEPVEVPEDPSIMLSPGRSTTRQTRRVKANAAKKEKLKKRLAAGGPGGGDGLGVRGEQGGRHVCGGRR
jgi:hypothetical protein